MNIRIMLVAYIFEEVDLILACEECGANTVDWSIAPTLYHQGMIDGSRARQVIEIQNQQRCECRVQSVTDLVVEATGGVQVIEIF